MLFWNNNNKNLSKRKAFSFIEMMISIFALSVVMLGFSGATSNVFRISADSSTQLKHVKHARFSSERIVNKLYKASYIYPSGISITLSGGITINTSDSVAMLIREDEDYRFVAYYFSEASAVKSHLNEFISTSLYEWVENTCPAAELTSFSGSSSSIADDIIEAESSLEYIINFNNSQTDQILKGGVTNVLPDNQFALIKGIDWEIAYGTTQTDVIIVKGTAANVPRFFE